ncbi:MAG TPA: hypothetical protein VFY18_00820, partial [Candidatus Limnocylindrales bacterium]|nr:hypothetical protein [Candidatus Limnocylindrales bacterium]
AAGSCRADFAILGQAPGLTGATPTDWFNVFGTEFDASVPATLTFGVPVIPWSIDQPTVVQAAVTTFAVPAADMAAGFKWTFRSRDRGVRSISVVVAGLDCQAKTVIKFALPATSTAEPSAPSQPLPVGPLALLLAFAGGVSAAWRRSGHHS